MDSELVSSLHFTFTFCPSASLWSISKKLRLKGGLYLKKSLTILNFLEFGQELGLPYFLEQAKCRLENHDKIKIVVTFVGEKELVFGVKGTWKAFGMLAVFHFMVVTWGFILW